MSFPQRDLVVSWAALGEYCQEVKWSDLLPQLSTGEATPGDLCPVLGSPVQERCGATGESLVKGQLR